MGKSGEQCAKDEKVERTLTTLVWTRTAEALGETYREFGRVSTLVGARSLLCPAKTNVWK